MQPARQVAEQPPLAHVAIIMDGNGRWARARSLPRTAGHKRGADAVRRVTAAAGELGISYLTLYGFSSENWRRPITEVDDLMGLLRLYLRRHVAELSDNGVALSVIGNRSRLPSDIIKLIEDAEEQTRANAKLRLTIALSYGAREELTLAARALAEAAKAGRLDPADIDEACFERHLFTAGIPDPDLVIRTSGEQRLSNFLLWQSAYSELVFTETLWPDFDKAGLEAAIQEYFRRDRRYGALGG